MADDFETLIGQLDGMAAPHPDVGRWEHLLWEGDTAEQVTLAAALLKAAHRGRIDDVARLADDPAQAAAALLLVAQGLASTVADADGVTLANMLDMLLAEATTRR